MATASSSSDFASGSRATGNGSLRSPTSYRFPAFDSLPPTFEEEDEQRGPSLGSPPLGVATNLGRSNSASARTQHGRGHGRQRQKSISEAIRTIRTRRGSVSQNAHEIADALKAPLSPTLVFLCLVWYGMSIFSNTSSKAILTALPRPVSLTLIQFFFVSSFCVVLSRLARIYPIMRRYIPVLNNEIRPPSRELINATFPLSLFQVSGHVLTADAMSRIPVSLVHTIKGLSPLFTVFAYRIFYAIHYRPATYLSLIPLTIGVIMACSANFSRTNFRGLLGAFASTILFVTQNIVSKKLFNEAAQAEADAAYTNSRNTVRKPDKLNLLCYSTGLAFILTIPLWLWSEGFSLLSELLFSASVSLSERPGSYDHGRLAVEFFFNGTFHFGQNLVAFVLLGMVSPVTYSVASLIKRVAIIIFAIIWFGNRVTPFQASGIGLTFVGLYLYDRTSDAAKADRRARVKQMQQQPVPDLLPLSVRTSPLPHQHPTFTQSPMSAVLSAAGQALPNGSSLNTLLGNGNSPHNTNTTDKKNDDAGFTSTNMTGGASGAGPLSSGRQGAGAAGNGTRARSNSGALQSHAQASSNWMPPGTRQEQTWRTGDGRSPPAGVKVS